MTVNKLSQSQVEGLFKQLKQKISNAMVTNPEKSLLDGLKYNQVQAKVRAIPYHKKFIIELWNLSSKIPLDHELEVKTFLLKFLLEEKDEMSVNLMCKWMKLLVKAKGSVEIDKEIFDFPVNCDKNMVMINYYLCKQQVLFIKTGQIEFDNIISPLVTTAEPLNLIFKEKKELLNLMRDKHDDDLKVVELNKLYDLIVKFIGDDVEILRLKCLVEMALLQLKIGNIEAAMDINEVILGSNDMNNQLAFDDDLFLSFQLLKIKLQPNFLKKDLSEFLEALPKKSKKYKSKPACHELVKCYIDLSFDKGESFIYLALSIVKLIDNINLFEYVIASVVRQSNFDQVKLILDVFSPLNSDYLNVTLVSLEQKIDEMLQLDRFDDCAAILSLLVQLIPPEQHLQYSNLIVKNIYVTYKNGKDKESLSEIMQQSSIPYDALTNDFKVTYNLVDLYCSTDCEKFAGRISALNNLSFDQLEFMLSELQEMFNDENVQLLSFQCDLIENHLNSLGSFQDLPEDFLFHYVYLCYKNITLSKSAKAVNFKKVIDVLSHLYNAEHSESLLDLNWNFFVTLKNTPDIETEVINSSMICSSLIDLYISNHICLTSETPSSKQKTDYINARMIKLINDLEVARSKLSTKDSLTELYNKIFTDSESLHQLLSSVAKNPKELSVILLTQFECCLVLGLYHRLDTIYCDLKVFCDHFKNYQIYEAFVKIVISVSGNVKIPPNVFCMVIKNAVDNLSAMKSNSSEPNIALFANWYRLLIVSAFKLPNLNVVYDYLNEFVKVILVKYKTYPQEEIEWIVVYVYNFSVGLNCEDRKKWISVCCDICEYLDDKNKKKYYLDIFKQA